MIEFDPVDSYGDRRRIREELQRTEAKGIRVDVADLCKCPECGGVHYKAKDVTDKTE